MQPPAYDPALLVGEERDALPALRFITGWAGRAMELPRFQSVHFRSGEERAPVARHLSEHLLSGLRGKHLVCQLLAEHKVQVVVSQHAPEVKKLLSDVKVREVVKIFRPVAERREGRGLQDLDAFRELHNASEHRYVFRREMSGEFLNFLFDNTKHLGERLLQARNCPTREETGRI